MIEKNFCTQWVNNRLDKCFEYKQASSAITQVSSAYKESLSEFQNLYVRILITRTRDHGS